MRALKLDPGHEAVLDAMAAQLGKLDKADDAIKWYGFTVGRPTALLNLQNLLLKQFRDRSQAPTLHSAAYQVGKGMHSIYGIAHHF